MFATTNAAAAVMAITGTVPYLVIDIETTSASEESIAQAIAAWKPGPNAKTREMIIAEADDAVRSWVAPSNIKDSTKIEERRQAAIEKIEATKRYNLEALAERRLEAIERIRSRSALSDAAPIICVGIQTPYHSIEFNGMDTNDYDIGGTHAVSCGNELDMLFAMRDWLDIHTGPDTVIVGQNVRGFDLPKLRNAYLRNRLRLPDILVPNGLNNETQVIDTAKLFRFYSTEHRDDFCPSLDVICSGLGIPKPKSVISGTEVPRLHSEGRYEEILIYNAIDREATTLAYLLMSGQSQDLI